MVDRLLILLLTLLFNNYIVTIVTIIIINEPVSAVTATHVGRYILGTSEV